MSGAAIFADIAAIPPWYWVAFGVLLIAAEMVIPAFILIWPGLAALVIALFTWIFPAMSGEVISILFAVLALALTFGGRALFDRGDQDDAATGLNARSARMVGQRAHVTHFAQGEGTIDVSGVQWPAIWTSGTSQIGDIVIIDRVEGVTVWVRPIET